VVASDGQHTYSCPILPVQVIETTGAGDAFGTGASYALLTGFGLPEALVAGTLNSASVVSAVGAEAGLLTETQIRERMLNRPLTVETIS
jgi:sugar/nucleoside kinase (ribokinase family)